MCDAPFTFPVIVLAQLAVDRSAQGQGPGEDLLLDALGRCMGLAETLGIHEVEADALTIRPRRST
jgi:hypothetical protein